MSDGTALQLTRDQEVALSVLGMNRGAMSPLAMARSGWLVGKNTRQCEAVLTSLIGTGLVSRVVQPVPGSRFPDVTYFLTASGVEKVKQINKAAREKAAQRKQQETVNG